MQMQSTDRRTSQYRPERDTVWTLLRSPAVRALLVTAAGLQGLAIVSERERAETKAAEELARDLRAHSVVALSVPVEPKVEVAAPKVPEAPEAKAEPKKAQPDSEEIAAKYRKQGYKVSSKLAQDIYELALDAEIDPEVAFGLIRAESGFRTSATSPVGAVGLMQLMPATASWMEPGVSRSKLRDTDTNLRVGFKYLRYLMDKYDGDEKLALLAYNRGPGTVDKALKRGRNPDNGYADFVYGKKDHGHKLYTRKRG